MNVIILEKGGEGLSLNEEQLRAALGDTHEYQVVSLSEVLENDGKLPEAWQGELFKCILVTNLATGFMNVHMQLVLNNPARLWCFAVTGAKQQLLREQLLGQIASRPELRRNGQFHMVFEDGEGFEETAGILDMFVRPEFTCIVASGDKDQAHAMAKMLAQINEDAVFIASDLDCHGALVGADCLVITGTRDEELMVPYPGGAQPHLAIWLNDAMSALPERERKARRERLVDALAGMGWDSAICRRSLFNGDIYMEQAALKWRSGESSIAALTGDERFAMWDEYGLPCTADAYNSEYIGKFFDKNCQLAALMSAAGL